MDQTIEYDQSGHAFRCRVVLLAANDLSDDEDALLVSWRADVILHRVLAAAHNPRGKNTQLVEPPNDMLALAGPPMPAWAVIALVGARDRKRA